MSKYNKLPLTTLHSLLVNKEVSASQLVEDAISSMKEDPCFCFEVTCFENARKQANKITEVKEEEFLKGIPFVCKDNFSHKGVKTTASSKILEDYVPLFDASVLQKLKKEGMILIAHTKMDELAMGGKGVSKNGITRNPYDLERIVGGSSSGSAASLALGMIPFALGSDTGDSIRLPASYTQTVGFKPTYGLVSRYGLFPFAPSLDCVSYLTRNVLDASYILSTLAFYDEKDFTSSHHRREKYQDYILQGRKKKRIGYLKEMLDNISSNNIREQFVSLLSALEKRGYEIHSFSFGKELLENIYPCYMILSSAEALSNDATLDGIRFGPNRAKEARNYIEYMKKNRSKGFSSHIKKRFLLGSLSLDKNYRATLFDYESKVRRLLVNRMEEFYQENDFLLMPSSFSAPEKIEDLNLNISSDNNFMNHLLSLANLGGYPSLTLPFMKEENMPLGINITAPLYQDGYVFSLGQEIEDITKIKDCVVEVAR